MKIMFFFMGTSMKTYIRSFLTGYNQTFPMQFTSSISLSMAISRPLGNGAKLSEVFLQRGYAHFENDYSFSWKRDKNSLVFLAFYVDDIIDTTESEIADLKSFLDITFKIKDLGHAHHFLGIQLSQSEQVFSSHKGSSPWTC